MPILNGVASLSSEAATLNSTAANIDSLVRNGNHIVAQVQRKGIGVSAQECIVFMSPPHCRKLTINYRALIHCIGCSCTSKNKAALISCMASKCASTNRAAFTSCMAGKYAAVQVNFCIAFWLLHLGPVLLSLGCCRTLRRLKTDTSTRLKWAGVPGGQDAFQFRWN